jgi:hypothetical protein
MIGTLRASALATNPSFVERPREGRGERRNNLVWLKRVAPPDRGLVELLLVGGRQASDFRIRVAQSHVRHDMTPSHWSHVCLVGERDRDALDDTEIVELSLEPRGGFGFPPPTNGVQVERLERYRDARAWPNVALVVVPLERKAIAAQVLQVFRNRSAVDLLELSLRWLAFVWGVAGAGNPLVEGVGVPSAVLVETLLGAAGFDVTPSLPARQSCPEAIWQAAIWWHDYYRRTREEQGSLAGVWCADDRLVEVSEKVEGARAPGRP